MELTYTWVYLVVAFLTHDLLRGHAGGLWRALGAAFWPVTFALALVAGVLLLPLVASRSSAMRSAGTGAWDRGGCILVRRGESAAQ